MRAAALLVGIGLVLLIGTVVVAALPSPRPAVQSGTLASGRLAVGSLVDEKVPDFRLVDDRGSRVSLAAFRGRYLVLAPAMTLCHEVCPMTAAALEQIKATLDRDGLAGQVTVAEATVDPWRDTPARLRAYRRQFGVDFTLLTGSQPAIRRLWKFFGVYYKRVPQGRPPDVDWLTRRPERFDVEHTDGLFIVDPNGRWRVAVIGMPAIGGALPARLAPLLNDQGRSNLRHPQAPWTPKLALADLFDVRQQEDGAPAGAVNTAPPPSRAEAARALTGSPAPLAALHSQEGELLGGGAAAFHARLASLRGHPVVINEWASWCFPCRNEFPLLSKASAAYGRRVAFVGVNVSDAAGSAKSFLRSHPVSYPSYADPSGAIAASFETAQALPITVFLTPDGRRAYTHIGYYGAQQALDSDIARYALGR
jgi:cytochrome oxidase Cu insertion factor (SCO1/SenC/PrrC family)/thiol-disulfide isomerase/thioredoxin